MSKIVLVLYGGVSPEHEISIISALQAMHALKDAGFVVLPGYISKAGEWYLGDETFFQPEAYKNIQKLTDSAEQLQLLPQRDQPIRTLGRFGRIKPVALDAVFPVFHGSNGEDGTMQGLLQLCNVPIMGCRLVTSATGIDKFISKRVAQSIGLNVNPDILITKSLWKENKNEIVNEIKNIGKQWFIKPNSLGSSIGLQFISEGTDLENAIDVALKYDERILVEAALKNFSEINISIVGNDPYEVSVTEQPVGTGNMLSFEDKYLSNNAQKNKTPGGMATAKRLIPAPVSTQIIKEVEFSAIKFFRSLGGKGLARIDFMIDAKGQIIFNEINTIPGSLAFYLWEKSGVSFPQLVSKLFELALEDWHIRQNMVNTFESNVLSHYQASGTKGSKT